MICKKCNNNYADTAKFCPKCGTKADTQVAVQDTQIKKCPKCGMENPLSAKFCKADGYNFQQVEEKTIAPSVDAEKPSDKILCPKCGTSYDLGVQFCKKDGTSLQKDSPVKEASVSPQIKSEVKQSQPPMSQRSAPSSAPPRDVTKKPEILSINDKKARQPRAENTGGRKTTAIIIMAVVLLVLIIAGEGGYLYYAGYFGRSPDKIASKINAELKAKDLSANCEIDKNWTATLKGTMKSPADKDLATGIVNAHKEIKDLKYDIQIPLSPAGVKIAIDNALRVGGINDVHSEVDENLTATLLGVVNSESEKESAIKIVVGLGKAKDVKDTIQIQAAISQPVAPERPSPGLRAPKRETRPRVDVTRKEVNRQPQPPPVAADPAKIERELNSTLRNAGLKGITAEVSDDLSVTLKGSTGRADEKSRALEIAMSANGIRKVRDRIFVVR